MRIGLCVGIEQAAWAARHEQLDYLELPVSTALVPHEPMRYFEPARMLIQTLPIRAEAANLLLPPHLRATGPMDEIEQDVLDDYIQRAFDRCETLGVEVVVFGSGPSRMVPPGFGHANAFEQLLGHLRRWAPMAQKARLGLAVEALNRGECNIINSLDEAVELARRTNHPAVGVVADTYHMGLENERPDAIEHAGALVIHVHCADPQRRVPLGLGSADHSPYFAALRRIGYDGRVSIEANWQDLLAQLPAAIAGLKRQLL